MARLEIPLRYRILYASGDVLLRAEIAQIKSRRGMWHQELFRVDPGSEMTTMFAALAKKLHVPMPQHAVANAVHGQTGLESRSGVLRVRIVGMDATEYALPCFFLGDPDAAVPSGQSPTTARKLLGISGVVNHLRICFDGAPGGSPLWTCDSGKEIIAPINPQC
jgi:endonuclease YncB( thermonuclease family)